MGKTIYIGSYVHSLQLTQLEHVERAIICVDGNGIIEWIENIAPEELQDVLAKYGLELDNVEVVELGTDEFLCPGLIDTHTVSRNWVNGWECRRRMRTTMLIPARPPIPKYRSGPWDPAARLVGEDHLPHGKPVCRYRSRQGGVYASCADDLERWCESGA